MSLRASVLALVLAGKCECSNLQNSWHRTSPSPGTCRGRPRNSPTPAPPFLPAGALFTSGGASLPRI